MQSRLFTAMFVAALCALSGSSLSAQATLSGVVLDDGTGEPIAAATVRLLRDGSTIQGVSTEADGAFTFRIRGLDPVQIEVERIGYRTARSGEIGLTFGLSLEVEFRVLTDAVVLDPIVVTAGGLSGASEFERRRLDWGRGQYFGPEDIEAMEMNYTADFFRHADGLMMTWGWTQGASGAGIPVPNVRVFAGRGCLNYMVDWVPVRLSPFSESSNPWASYQLEGLEPDDIQAVEIYRYPGEAPPEIRRYVNSSRVIFTDDGIDREDRDLCGLVVIWTKAGWGAREPSSPPPSPLSFRSSAPARTRRSR